MGFRQSTPFKVLPGVRLTIRDPASGERRPLTIRGVTPPAPDDRTARRPGPRAHPWERRLHRSLLLGDAAEVRRVAGRRGHRVLGAALGGLTAYATGAGPARALLDEAWRSGDAVEEHPFLSARLLHATVRIDVTDDVQAVVPVSRDAVGLALVASLRELAETEAATVVAEELDPSVVAALALTDLYRRTGRPDDLVELTSGVSNTDDASALLLLHRATALRVVGLDADADAALQEAVRWGVRGSVVRRLALSERDRMARGVDGGVE